VSDSHTDTGDAEQRHPDIPPELRVLAQSILGRLDPAVKLLAAKVQAGGPGKCEQVWCPVCALAALISGEQHPMLNVVAEHSVGLLTLAKAMLDNFDSTSPQPADAPPDDLSEPKPRPEPEPPPASPEPGHYQHITVVTEGRAD
jgi:hypothetical protein